MHFLIKVAHFLIHFIKTSLKTQIILWVSQQKIFNFRIRSMKRVITGSKPVRVLSFIVSSLFEYCYVQRGSDSKCTFVMYLFRTRYIRFHYCNSRYLVQSTPHISLVVRKPVFGVSDKVRHKPDCTATEDG